MMKGFLPDDFMGKISFLSSEVVTWKRTFHHNIVHSFSSEPQVVQNPQHIDFIEVYKYKFFAITYTLLEHLDYM